MNGFPRRTCGSGNARVCAVLLALPAVFLYTANADGAAQAPDTAEESRVDHLSSDSDTVVLREDFDSLDRWQPLTFPKIERHTRYSITNLDGQAVLKAEADASASGLVLTNAFDPYDTPVLRWRWRVENVLRKGDATRKDGDDYPLRVYILFEYDPERASLGTRAQYGLARRLYGEYPPHASLNYIWANRKHDRRILPSPYTDRSQMIALRAGDTDVGQWLDEDVNILEDYRAAFGSDPPHTARLAVMSDADNTGEAAVAYMLFIERSERGLATQR